jgi:hypothetical protein
MVIVLGTMFFLLCLWVASLPVATPVSLSLAFRPWWRYWQLGAFIGLIPTLMLGMFHATRHLLDNLT